jgi:hypothetical protein
VTLNDWERNGWLQAHLTTPEEVADLLALVERDLADSQTSGLSADFGGRTLGSRFRPGGGGRSPITSTAWPRGKPETRRW